MPPEVSNITSPVHFLSNFYDGCFLQTGKLRLENARDLPCFSVSEQQTEGPRGQGGAQTCLTVNLTYFKMHLTVVLIPPSGKGG